MIRWIGIFFFMMSFSFSGFAWTIGAKGHATGPAFHTTYFLTPNNQAFEVRAKAFVGNLVNGTCQYQIVYDIGTDQLKTGDFVDLDAFAFMDTVGGGYSCMAIEYFLHQMVTETLQLFWDGIHYFSSYPSTSEVVIT